MSKIVKFWQLYQLVQYVLAEVRRIFESDEVKK